MESRNLEIIKEVLINLNEQVFCARQEAASPFPNMFGVRNMDTIYQENNKLLKKLSNSEESAEDYLSKKDKL